MVKGEGAWRHAFDAADPPSSNQLVIEMSTCQVLITDVSGSLLCCFCKKLYAKCILCIYSLIFGFYHAFGKGMITILYLLHVSL